jgi:1-deoxy-D-xylulose 5-phosphate reductoisomerase
LHATFQSGWKSSESRRTRRQRELAAQANELRPGAVCIVDETKLDELRTNLNYKPEIFWGEAGLREIASKVASDMVLIAIVGTGGLRPALAAIEAGKDLAVASKEILVMAGEIVMREAREKGVHVLPVDSEHNAIFQCLEGRLCSKANAQRTTPNAQRPTQTVQRSMCPMFAALFSQHQAARSAKRPQTSFRISRSNKR